MTFTTCVQSFALQLFYILSKNVASAFGQGAPRCHSLFLTPLQPGANEISIANIY